MASSTMPVQSGVIQTALGLNADVKPRDLVRQTSFGRDRVTFTPVGQALNRALTRSGIGPPSPGEFSGLEVLRGRAGSRLASLAAIMGGASFTATLQALSRIESKTPGISLASIFLSAAEAGTDAEFAAGMGQVSDRIQQVSQKPG